MTRIIKRSFSLTEKDLEIIRMVVEKCGFVSDSEALRAIIRFYAEHAQCIKSQ
jgi:Arc/MetJ-type ribon-helix-helix transcriptional regulator